MPELEEVGSYVRQRAGRILLHHLQILLSHFPHRGAAALKQCWVVEVPLWDQHKTQIIIWNPEYHCSVSVWDHAQTCTHDPLHSCLLDAAQHITQVLDVAVCKHGNIYHLPGTKPAQKNRTSKEIPLWIIFGLCSCTSEYKRSGLVMKLTALLWCAPS